MYIVTILFAPLPLQYCIILATYMLQNSRKGSVKIATLAIFSDHSTIADSLIAMYVAIANVFMKQVAFKR